MKIDENIVVLNFKENIVMLAGYEYGVQIYEQQGKKIDFQKSFTVVFPDSIVGVASSFVQGFFAEAKRTVGIENLKQRLNVKCKNEMIANKIMSKLY